MKTDGGGWTLVYSYTFTNYASFTSSDNAVTPRPNWPASSANVLVSTRSPLGESENGAMDFGLWKMIGKEALLKSNLNDWIVCKPNGGSLVKKTDGHIKCKNIKNIATSCVGIAPTYIVWGSCGPYLRASRIFYNFDGSTSSCYPQQDPCGQDSPKNRKKGVSNPRGTIFIR